MFSFEFMRNAYTAGTLIAIVSGGVMGGVFVIARKMAFMTHTLSEIGFAGASFGMFAGWSPLNGMLLFTIVSSILVGGRLSGTNESRRESVISAISGLFIGLGILFLALSDQSSSYATNILFGSVVGISRADVWQMSILSLAILLVVLLVYRNLKDASFDPTGARANGVAVNILGGVVFLVLLALA